MPNDKKTPKKSAVARKAGLRPAIAKASVKRPVAQAAIAPKVVKKPAKAATTISTKVATPKLGTKPVIKKSATSGEQPRKARKSAGREIRRAKFAVGQIVRHRIYPFRGVVFDIDPVFANSEEWWQAIPTEIRPRKDQPFYHLLAENADTEYIAYVSEQNLLADESGVPLRHPGISEYFVENDDGTLRSVYFQSH